MNRNNREFYNDIVAKIIEQLKKHPYTEIVEGDLFVGVTKKHSDRTVDVLVDGAAYVDDERSASTIPNRGAAAMNNSSATAHRR